MIEAIERITKVTDELELHEKELQIANNHLREKVWMLGPTDWSASVSTRVGRVIVRSDDHGLSIDAGNSIEKLLEAIEGGLLEQLELSLRSRVETARTALQRVRSAIAMVEVDHG